MSSVLASVIQESGGNRYRGLLEERRGIIRIWSGSDGVQRRVIIGFVWSEVSVVTCDYAACCVLWTSEAVTRIPASPPNTANQINPSRKGNGTSWLVTSQIRTAGGLISDLSITS